MSLFDEVYLGMVIVGMLSFMGTLAWASWRVASSKPKQRAAHKPFRAAASSAGDEIRAA